MTRHEGFTLIEILIVIFIAGIPIEETLFSFSIGAFWSVLYEYTRGYRTK